MDLNMKFWWRKNWEKPYLYLAGIDMVFRTTSIPRRYRYGFLDILSISLHLYEVHHIKRLHYTPLLPMISFIERSYRFEHEIFMKKKLKKIISIPGWNRYGFLNHIYTSKVYIWFFGYFVNNLAIVWSAWRQMTTPYTMVIIYKVFLQPTCISTWK